MYAADKIFGTADHQKWLKEFKFSWYYQFCTNNKYVPFTKMDVDYLWFDYQIQCNGQNWNPIMLASCSNISITLFAHTYYKVVHRKCNCITNNDYYIKINQ